MSSKLEFRESEKGAWHILSAIGRLDTVTAPEGEKAGLAGLAAHEKLVFDLTALEYLSSAGLRMLLNIAKQAKKGGREFALSGAVGMVKEVLEASGMDLLVTFCDSVDDLP